MWCVCVWSKRGKCHLYHLSHIISHIYVDSDIICTKSCKAVYSLGFCRLIGVSKIGLRLRGLNYANKLKRSILQCDSMENPKHPNITDLPGVEVPGRAWPDVPRPQWRWSLGHWAAPSPTRTTDHRGSSPSSEPQSLNQLQLDNSSSTNLYLQTSIDQKSDLLEVVFNVELESL